MSIIGVSLCFNALGFTSRGDWLTCDQEYKIWDWVTLPKWLLLSLAAIGISISVLSRKSGLLLVKLLA